MLYPTVFCATYSRHSGEQRCSTLLKARNTSNAIWRGRGERRFVEW